MTRAVSANAKIGIAKGAFFPVVTLTASGGYLSGDVESLFHAIGERTCAPLLHDWRLWARPEQLPPESAWTTWLYMGGRGAGKTRAGAEWIRARVASGLGRRIALVASTAADARDVMI